MADALEEFFEQLGTRGHDRLLAKAEGMARFDIADGKRTERWLLTLDKGHVSVSRKNTAADMVVKVPRPLFERIVQGKANAMAAVLRGELTIEGSTELLVLFQRLLPRPSDAKTRGVEAGYARRSR
jgi:putative sterol carrier protein